MLRVLKDNKHDKYPKEEDGSNHHVLHLLNKKDEKKNKYIKTLSLYCFNPAFIF